MDGMGLGGIKTGWNWRGAFAEDILIRRRKDKRSGGPGWIWGWVELLGREEGIGDGQKEMKGDVNGGMLGEMTKNVENVVL